MTDTAIRSQNGRTSLGSAKPVGVSGVVQYGGVLYSTDYDKSWRGFERDKTIMSMGNDPLIGSVLFGVEMLIRRVDWKMQPADDTPAAQDVADFIEDCLNDMDGYWPGDTLAQALTFLTWGYAVLEITYKLRLGANAIGPLPSTKAAPQSRSNDGRIGWHRWALRPQATRYGWEFERDDPVAFVQQDPQTFNLYTIPLSKCLHFKYASRDNSPEGTTPLRTAFDAWYYKRRLQQIEAIGIERELAGLPVMRIPGASLDANDAIYQAARTVVEGIRQDSQSGVVISSDRDEAGNLLQELYLLSSGGTRSFDTDVTIKRYANEVVTVFLANVMRTGQDATGSYALAETQGSLFQQAIGAHLDTIGQAITEQAILPLLRMNGIDDALTPELVHGDIESADLTRLGTYLLNLANAGLLAPTPELKAWVHEVAGLPVPTEDDLAALAQAEADAAAAAAEAARAAFDSGANTGLPNDTAPEDQAA